MSQPTLASVRDFVRDEIPGCPLPKIIRKLNLVMDEIYDEVAQVEWSTFTTKADVAGTVNVVNGSPSITTVSGSPLIFPIDGQLHFIQIGDDTTWYPVVPSSTSAGALASAYAGTTNTAATYKLVFPTVALPAGVNQVLFIEHADAPLEFATKENAETRWSSAAVGTPRWWGPYVSHGSLTPDDAHRIILTPYPDTVASYEYSFMRRWTDILTTVSEVDAATTKLGVDQLFDRAVTFGTLALCWSGTDGEAKFGPWWGRFQVQLKKARATMNKQVSGQRGGGQRGGKLGRAGYYQDPPS